MLYYRPDDLRDALEVLARHAPLVLAGGTDLYPATPGRTLAGPVLDITGVASLSGIRRADGMLRIGACTTWSALIAADLPPAFDALRAAASEVGGWQIQVAGTIAGNLCNASPAADGAPPLMVLDAQVEIACPAGLRRLPLTDFLRGPRRTDLRAGEILTAILIPESAITGRSAFLKLGARRHLVISIAMVAARIAVEAGRVTQAALAVGACSAIATRLGAVEAALLGAPADAALAARIDPAQVAEALAPIDDIRADAWYRAEAAAELLSRAVARLAPHAEPER